MLPGNVLYIHVLRGAQWPAATFGHMTFCKAGAVATLVRFSRGNVHARAQICRTSVFTCVHIGISRRKSTDLNVTGPYLDKCLFKLSLSPRPISMARPRAAKFCSNGCAPAAGPHAGGASAKACAQGLCGAQRKEAYTDRKMVRRHCINSTL